MWDLSCIDWQDRIRDGRSLIPDLPLIQSEADMGLAFFDALQLPDVEGQPFLRDAAGQWFRDIVRVAFGSWSPEQRLRFIRDILLLAPKGQSKTSYSAGLCLTAMLMNRRPNAEMLFIGPTQAISDRAFEQAAGMIDVSRDLQKRFRAREHIKTIVDLHNDTALQVKTFDVNILTGSFPVFVLLDEIHLLGRMVNAAKVIRQIRGGLEKRPEGLFLMTTTQSDDVPRGVFKDEMLNARKIRDGEMRGIPHRPLLPILYEFPLDIAKDQAKWENPANWSMVMPNLGRSVQLESLIGDYASEKIKGPHAVAIWSSQHLNIEMGVGLHTDRWKVVDFWAKRAITIASLDDLLARCDVVTVGIDGGGLDDLFSLAVLGREAGTGRWLVWVRAWASEGVLEQRKSEATTLQDFAEDGDLIFFNAVLENQQDRDDDPVEARRPDLQQAADIVQKVHLAGKLGGVGVDGHAGLKAVVNSLEDRGIGGEANYRDGPQGLILMVPQNFKLTSTIKEVERRLAEGSLLHAGQPLMAWCVTNVRVTVVSNGLSITKQNAGTAKIDPVLALLNAAFLMLMEPVLHRHSVYEERGLVLL